MPESGRLNYNNWQKPGFHIDQEVMEYLTKCVQPVVVVVNNSNNVMRPTLGP